MVDFFIPSTRPGKRKGTIEIYPKFIIRKSSDLMIRGGDFYAVWIEELGLWSTDEDDLIRLIDNELDKYAEENRNRLDGSVRVLHMWDAESGMIDAWHKYCQRQVRANYIPLDEKLIFSNHETVKKDYASKRLNYPLEPGSINAYDKIMSTLYDPEERHKIEWAIGSVITGDSKRIEKFLVIYGSPGSGKGTILNNIVLKLFEGYSTVFDAKALGSSSNSFALEMFKSNPLVAVQLDGDLSRIEDNTRINSLVSHELMTVNEKFKAAYTMNFKCFLFMGTNKPVKITDANSGLIRRLIDVYPSGRKLPPREYRNLVKQLEFELGAIACHCRDIYLDAPDMYEDYVPVNMLGATNDFYNFIMEAYNVFERDNCTTLKAAYEMYKTFCTEANVLYPLSRRAFGEELKNYFEDYKDRYNLDDGTRVRCYYTGFKTDKFESTDEQIPVPVKEEPKPYIIEFEEIESIFDRDCFVCPAQYASNKETPTQKWDDVTTILSELDTTKLHYVKVPENHIVIDFDIPDENGNKCFEKNLEAASKWPPTYAELSKSGAGIHLHYIYTGDASKLSRVYDDHIEVKVFTGKSSLRRKLTKCNNLEISSISSGLPLKGDKKMINTDVIKSEKVLRLMILRNLNKEYHPGTKPSVDFIHKILEDAYNNGLNYDVTDMRNAVLAFAANSTHQAEYCIKLVNKMQFKSVEPAKPMVADDSKIIFYDVEVFPNLFLINWKIEGEGQPVIRMINPKPAEVEELTRFKLVGFNCRDYDNHMLYGALMGYDNEQLYELSKKIINKDKKVSRDAKFGEAYNISYTDVYDFSRDKMSLKKWEIKLGIHHKELGLPWDQPVPEDKWELVAEYCDNDVIATEAVFNHLKESDFLARQILADIAGGNVNDTTNSLSAKFIFGDDYRPQSQFNYRNLGEINDNEIYTEYFITNDVPPKTLAREVDIYDINDPIQDRPPYDVFDKKDRPHFPGYKFENGKSTYRGEDVGEGGYVYAEPGMYSNVALLDVASMHPSSVIAENLFGDIYTARFAEIVQARLAIKHKDIEKAKTLLGGVLAKYLTDDKYFAELAGALKIVINSVYGLTSAKFENRFRDPRNVDNIVAKRGALFMINLKHAVQQKGFTVVHIKTDSIKIADATPEIIDFVMAYGKCYGYTFEHEATYDRICLVNDAVYIAKYKDGKHAGEWTPTGAQFQHPVVFKKLFSNEELTFNDKCETNSVKEGVMYLDMNEGLPDVTEFELIKDIRGKAAKNKKLTKREISILEENEYMSDEHLDQEIAKGHNYIFVGKVGQFCPVQEGTGGGILYRITEDGSKYAVTGTKGYRWMESEMVKTLEKENDIDDCYFNALIDGAVENISNYGDFTWFAN